MYYRKLGNTEYNVSCICFGSLTIGPLAANLPLAEGVALLCAAFANGINFIDTAQYYQNYAYIREALAIWQGDVIIASKSYASTYKDMAASVEEARKELNSDKIDIFLLHEQANAAAIDDNRHALEYLLTAKDKGIIGAVGISSHDVSAVAYAASLPEIDVIHPLINISGIGIKGGSLPEMVAAVEFAYKKGKGIYSMKAIGGGALMNRAEEALKWAFDLPYVHSVAIGMRDIAELDTNISYLSGEEALYIDSIKQLERNLHIDKNPGCSGCGCCVKKCSQKALYLNDGTVHYNRGRCIFCGYCIPACPWFCLSIS